METLRLTDSKVRVNRFKEQSNSSGNVKKKWKKSCQSLKKTIESLKNLNKKNTEVDRFYIFRESLAS